MAYLALRRLVVDEATVDGEEVRQDGHTGDEVLVYERLVIQLLASARTITFVATLASARTITRS